jgi:hypothetical protein
VFAEQGKNVVDANLAQMGDRELLKLFALIGEGRGGKRTKQVLAELQWRGYL